MAAEDLQTSDHGGSPEVLRSKTRFTVQKELGRGSFGVVCLCLDHENKDRVVTLKTISFSETDFELCNQKNLKDKNQKKNAADPHLVDRNAGANQNRQPKKNSVLFFALKEASVLKELKNRYIVRYYDSFLEKSNLQIVMEYCPNGDLCQLLKSKGRLNESVRRSHRYSDCSILSESLN